MRYFAYGANMHTGFFKRQFPDVKAVGVARIQGYQLFFHKFSYHDGSGKCNILPTRDINQEVYGVIYDISPRSRYLLDKVEQLGYGTQDVMLKVHPILVDEQATLDNQYAFTYIAHRESIREDVCPFNWYKELVVAGAREHQLPEHYLNRLETSRAIEDPNQQRNRQSIASMVAGLTS